MWPTCTVACHWAKKKEQMDNCYVLQPAQGNKLATNRHTACESFPSQGSMILRFMATESRLVAAYR